MKNACSLVLFIIIAFASHSAHSNVVSGDALQMLSNKYEQELRTSPLRSKNKILEDYLRIMTCKIADKFCSSVRVYLLRKPGLNAFMLPNGAMFIQTGLLLRITSESEIASVIGHEIIHYTEFHSLEKFKARKKTQQVSNLISIGLSSKGLSSIGSSLLIDSVAKSYLGAYSRDAEREADKNGLKLAANAGYDPKAASNVWNNFKNELKASKSINHSLFSTHPPLDERMKNLSKLATKYAPYDSQLNVKTNEGLIDIVAEERFAYINDEMQYLHPNQFLVLLQNQKTFFDISTGMEKYLCAKSWDKYSYTNNLNQNSVFNAKEKALECFQEAIKSGTEIPSSAYREFAKLSEEIGNYCDAKYSYKKYLELLPDAWDAKFIKKKLENINCPKIERIPS